MKKASRIMYIIATVFAAISLVTGIILAIIGGAGLALQNDPNMSGVSAQDCQLVLTWGIIIAVFAIVDILIGTFGRRAAAKKKGGNAPHIVAIVIGILGLNIFFILGGAFGIAGAKEDATSNG